MTSDRQTITRGAARTRLLLSASVAAAGLMSYGRAAHAQDCANPSADRYVCSGAITATQNLDGADLVVTTEPGFSIDTGSPGSSGGDAFDLDSTGSLDFSDANGSPITGARDGIDARNDGAGALSITVTGDVEGRSGFGIYARQGSASMGDLTISTAGVSGGYTGILALSTGSGDVTITATGDVTGSDIGIASSTTKYSASDTTITATDVSGGAIGISAAAGAGALTISANDVSGSYYGIDVRDEGSGTVHITVTGDVVGSNDDYGVGIRTSSKYSSGGPVLMSVSDAPAMDAGGTAESGAGDGSPARTIMIASGASVTGAGGTAILDADASGGKYGPGGGYGPGSGSATFVITSGDIVGDVRLNDGDDRFEFRAGASVDGTVDGGDGADVFALGGMSLGAGVDASVDVGDVDLDNDGATPFGTVGITGFESFVKTGSSTFELTGTNDEVGALDLQEGGLVVAGAFAGLAITGADGTLLQGTGTLRSLSTTGAVNPGADGEIGTLRVTGDVALGDGSTLAVDVADDGGTSDLLDAGGAVAIDDGATVSASLAGDLENLPRQGDFTILTADGGVSGQFGTVTDDLPDIVLVAEYDPNAVRLTYDIDDEDTSAKGGTAAGLRGALTANLLFADALRGQGGGDGGPDTVISTRGGMAPAAAPPALGYGVIAGLFGGRTEVDGDGSGAGYETDAAGLFVGTAGSFGVRGGVLNTGLAIGYTEGDSETDGNRAELEALQLGLFAGYDSGPLALDGALSFGALDYDLTRTPVAGTVATGETDGRSIALSFEASYDVADRFAAAPAGLELRPSIGIDVAHARVDAYTEQGAGLLNLDVDEAEATTVFAHVGIEVARTFALQGGILLRPSLSLGYERAFGDLGAATTSSLAGLGGAFTDTLAEIDEDRGLLGLGLEFGSGDVTGFAAYEGTFGDGTEDHQASIGLRIAF